MKRTILSAAIAVLGVGCAGELFRDSSDTAQAGLESSTVTAVDVSHWSDEVSQEQMRCWWEEHEVRHVIAGTQVPRITRQQLGTAERLGMSVDAYVYLHWDRDFAEQVEEAFEVVDGFAIQRMWLDVEEHPGARTTTELAAQIEAGLAACGTRDCGIYTGAWWWDKYMRTRPDVGAGVPLWYAYYDDDPSMETWDWQQFGGWAEVVGKQYIEDRVCGVTVDLNTMELRDEAQNITPRRTFAAAPPAPEYLQPSGVEYGPDAAVMLSIEEYEDAQGYEFEVQHFRNGLWRHYGVFPTSRSWARFNPVVQSSFQWRARVRSGSTWGEWSRWAGFAYGDVSAELIAAPVEPETPSNTEPMPEPEAQPAEPEPAANPQPAPVPTPEVDTPTNATPADGADFVGGGVTLRVDPQVTAVTYVFEIDVERNGSWVDYFTYRRSAPSTTVYPAYSEGSYRWRVHAEFADREGPPTDWLGFTHAK